MNYAVLSLPDKQDVETCNYYLDDHPANLERKAEKYAEKSGMVRGADYEIFPPSSAEKLSESLDQIRKCTVVYLDAHGYKYPPGTINVPASSPDSDPRQDVPPSDLGLRASSIELLVAGVCNQDARSWENAVPPGCVVIGYNKNLLDIHYRHMYERFIDLNQLVKHARPPQPHETQAWQNHIVEWFEHCLAKGTRRPASSDWFITVGKQSPPCRH